MISQQNDTLVDPYDRFRAFLAGMGIMPHRVVTDQGSRRYYYLAWRARDAAWWCVEYRWCVKGGFNFLDAYRVENLPPYADLLKPHIASLRNRV